MLAIFVGVRTEHTAVDRHLEVLDEQQTRDGYFITQGTYRDKPVLVCRTHMGEKRVLPIMDEVIHQHPISAVLSLRVSGALPADLGVGEIVLCPRTLLFMRGQGIVQPKAEADLRLLHMAGYAATNAGLRHRVGGAITFSPLSPLPVNRDVLGENRDIVIADTDGYWMAETAREHGLPFLSVRASLGDCYDRMPETLAMVGSKAYVSPWTLVSRTITHPQRLPNLVRLINAVRVASRSLSRFTGSFLAEWDRMPAPTRDRER